MVRFKILTFVFSALAITMTSCSSNSKEEARLYTEVATVKSEVKTSQIENEVIDLVNDYRISRGLNTLEFGEVAYEFAVSHNDYMIAEGRISHDNFDIRSSNLSVKANADFVSENVGKDFTSAEGVVEAWINSDVHREVMEGDFTYTAVNIKADDQGILYFTQLFYK